MNLSESNLKLILGYKLKQFRLKAKLSLQELSHKANLSLSYISEIEQGKKYPKPEKIIVLSQALGRTFDELVSLRLDDEQNPLMQLLSSPILNEFPWEQFGISIRDIVRLVGDSPSKAGALIQTFHEIGTNYDMHVEHFLFATLRSLQTLQMNYFEDVEKAAEKFLKENAQALKNHSKGELFTTILTENYRYQLDYETLGEHPELKDLRSVWVHGKRPKLLVNRHMQPSQKDFILAKEIGYQRLGLKERPGSSSYIQPESFEQIFNNFKASYFAGAVLLEKKKLVRELKKFFGKPRWEAAQFAEMMNSLEATSEMFLYRLSEILPKFFDLRQFFYMRFHHDTETGGYNLSKSLNTTQVFLARGNDQTEHHCRRWISIRSLLYCREPQNSTSHLEERVFAQRSRFIDGDQEFFSISVVYPSTSGDLDSSITLGLLVDDQFKEHVKFWNDPEISRVDVHETCERCPLNEQQCNERVAPPSIYRFQKKQTQRKNALKALTQELS